MHQLILAGLELIKEARKQNRKSIVFYALNPTNDSIHPIALFSMTLKRLELEDDIQMYIEKIDVDYLEEVLLFGGDLLK